MTVTTPEHTPDASEIAACLLGGGVVLLPTDTVLGLAASPWNADAVAKLYRLKRRPSERRLPVMVAEASQLGVLGVDVKPPAARLLASRFMPGPLTIALGFSSDKPDWLAERDEVAVRIPADERLLAVLRLTGPLFVTSANAHGAPTPLDTGAALLQLDGSPDLVVPGRPGGSTPSTLVNCRVDPPAIERAGAVPAGEIEALL